MHLRKLLLSACVFFLLMSPVFGEDKPASPIPRVDLYGDPLPEGSVARLGTVRFSTHHSAWAVAISPDGKTLATGSIPGSVNGVVELWDAVDGRRICQLLDGGTNIFALAWSPDGKQLAVSLDYRLEVWNVKDRAKLFEVTNPEAPKRGAWTLRWATDGKNILGVTSDSLNLWNVADRKLSKSRKFEEQLYSLDVSSEGTLIAVAAKNSVHLQKADDLTQIRTIRSTGVVHSVAFSADGSLVAGCIEAGDKQLKVDVWKVASGEMVKESSKFTSAEGDLDFTAEGHIIIAISDKLGFWNLEEDAPRFVPKYGCCFWFLSLSADRQLVATAGDRAGVWNSSDGSPLLDGPTDTGVSRAMFFSADGKTMTTATGRTIRRWDTRTGRLLNSSDCPNDIWATAQSPDRKSLAVYTKDGRITLCALSGDARDIIFEGDARPVTSDSMQLAALSFSANGDMLAAGGFDNHLRQWSLLDRKLLSDERLPKQIVHLEYSPDGSLLAVAPLEQNLQLWNLKAPRKVAEIAESKGLFWGPFAFSPDGKLMAVSGPVHDVRSATTPSISETLATIRLVRCADQSLVWESKTTAWIKNLAFSPDGKLLASSGGIEKNIQIWSAKTGKFLKNLPLDELDAPTVAFSPDSKTLATSNIRGPTLLWDVSTLSSND